jgi:putative transposase
MGSMPPLLSFLLMVVSGWVHRHQLIVIEFLQAEDQLLKKRLRGKRIRFTDAERALLGRKAKAVGRKALIKLDTIVCPDTLLRWHRQFVSQKWNFSHRHRPGRPPDSGPTAVADYRSVSQSGGAGRWGVQCQ